MRPTWIDFDGRHFVTVCGKPRGTDQLANDRMAIAVRDSLIFLQDKGLWHLDAMVVMPDHVHWLARVPRATDLGHTVRHWKRYVARHSRVRWQRDFFERRLRAMDRTEDTIAYLRDNPVKAGLVETPSDWPYYWSWNLDPGRDGRPGRPSPR